jgi:Domain of unknown function (DUF4386)
MGVGRGSVRIAVHRSSASRPGDITAGAADRVSDADRVRRMLEAAGERRAVFRIGGSSAVAGALLGLVGNLIHPVTAGPGDPEATARVVAQSRIWVPVHLALLVAFLLMLGGLVAIHDAIGGGLPGALARFGLASAVVGSAVGVVLISLDGFAAKHLAEAWLSAPTAARAAAIGPFRAEDSINFALLSPLNLLFAGFTFVLFGLAAALSGAWPRWLGWTAAVGGAGGALSGVIQAYMGQPTAITKVLGIAAPTVITLWLLVMGVLLIRRLDAPATGRRR